MNRPFFIDWILMDIKSLKSSGTLANNFGVKAVLYGGPGTGKTPIIATAPRPVLVACEPGLLSMRGTNIPTWEAYTVATIGEFFTWYFKSAEARNFDTLGVDSVSQMAEIYLRHFQGNNRDGRKAYGEMSLAMMDLLNALYFKPQSHIVLIAKQTIADDNGVTRRRPFFPGQDLNVKVPHLFDGIFHMGIHNVPGVQQPTKAICTMEQFDLMARDRSGKLATFEPPHLGNIFNKIMT